MASSLPCEILSSGQTEVDSLEGQAENIRKAILGILPSYPGLELSLPKNAFSILIPNVFLTCLAWDFICPFYNFILTSNLKLSLPTLPGLEVNCSSMEQRDGLAWPLETCPHLSFAGRLRLQCGGMKRGKGSPLLVWLKYFTVASFLFIIVILTHHLWALLGWMRASSCPTDRE